MALVREIREELRIEIGIDDELIPVTHAYGEKVVRLFPYLCRWTGGTMELTEHHTARWIAPGEIDGYDMLDADHKMLGEGDNFVRLLEYAQG